MSLIQRADTTILADLAITTAATENPVADSDLKSYAKISNSTDDALITILANSVSDWVSKYLGRSLVNQTITAYFSQYSHKVYLPYPPAVSITSVKQKRLNSSETFTANSDYYLMGVQDKWLEFPTTATLPAGTSPGDNVGDYQLEVVYVAGYGTTGEDVPAQIREACMRIFANSYKHREDDVIGVAVVNVDRTSYMMLQPFRNMRML